MSVITDEIKKLDEKFDNIRLEEAVYSRRDNALKVSFLLSRHFNENDEKAVEDKIKELVPFAKVKAELKKAVCDPELVQKRIAAYVFSNCAPVKERVKPENFVVKTELGKATVNICAEEEVCSYFKAGSFITELSEYLKGYFCEDFSFEFSPCENKESESDIFAEEKVDYARIEQIPLRYFTVEAVTRLFDNNSNDRVMYIADACDKTGELTIAGKVVGRREMVTKAGKPFFLLDLNDGTGRMTGSLFTNSKDTLRKMEKVQEGSEVIVLGHGEINDKGYHRFNIKSINFCCLPQNFVYEERASRRPPETYETVSPSPMEEIRQTNMFSNDSVPECFKGTSFVVVDLETTGTTPSTDAITEIGAVKMVDGKVTEKFSTMINPERRIPEDVVALTGITDDMVKDAPVFAKVAGDLYKFCFGSVIIAHNLSFDYTFIKNFSKPCSYAYNNHGIDTLAFARRLFPEMSNHKLNTVCEKFGIEFLHHRAYSDAFATAQMFIEMVRINGSLPDYDV